jgi:hypothetical protein
VQILLCGKGLEYEEFTAAKEPRANSEPKRVCRTVFLLHLADVVVGCSM